MPPSTAVLAEDAVDLSPVLLHSAEPDSRDGEQLLGLSGMADFREDRYVLVVSTAF